MRHRGKDLADALSWFEVGLARGDARAAAAAYLLMTEEVEGYDLTDAAVLAAKGAALTNSENASGAREQLDALPEDVVNAGARALINELGGSVEVNGSWGPDVEAAMQEVLSRKGRGPVSDDAHERAVQLAQLTWELSPFRVDLY